MAARRYASDTGGRFAPCKGAPALESRTEGWLVSPTTALEKKIVPPPGFGFEA